PLIVLINILKPTKGLDALSVSVIDRFQTGSNLNTIEKYCSIYISANQRGKKNFFFRKKPNPATPSSAQPPLPSTLRSPFASPKQRRSSKAQPWRRRRRRRSRH